MHQLKVQALVNQLYCRYKYGFYVNAEQRMKDARGAAKYIGELRNALEIVTNARIAIVLKTLLVKI